MTDDNSNLVDMDLDNFSETFFGNGDLPDPEAPAEPEAEEDEDGLENEDDSLATGDEDAEGTDEGEDETSDEEDEDEPEQKPKGKKSARERIEELYAANKQKERELADLRAAVEALKTSKPEADTKPTGPTPQVAAAEAPQPTDLDEDGEPKYRLGEFDPLFIRDLTRFTITEERKAAEAEQAKTEQQRMVEAAQEELKSSWLSKVEEAEKELPDLREHLGTVGEAFAGIDPNYGEFLAATIMSCDYGPQIMYYLSQNIGEAQKIVASGPNAATLAIGRLDARFTKPTEEKRNTNRVSNAPKPPEAVNKGSGNKTSVPGDTNDLGAFEKEFFVKK